MPPAFSNLAFCTDARFVDHLTGPHHPERPDRIRAVALAVRRAGLVASANPFPDFDLDLQLNPLAGEPLLELPAMIADEKWLQLVHPPGYIDRIRHLCQAGGGILDSGDTPASPVSFDIARRAVGAMLACCDAVMEGRARRAFAALRPPGHHAEPDRPMGFCLFGNIAIAAKYLQHKHRVGKVAIVDFDVHHGNGTQAAFIDDPSVLFISIHQHPRTCYPGSGYEWETGQGAGEGTTLNIPMQPGTGDDEYRQALHERILPKLADFKPEILLISAGFDGHRDDPLAQIELSEQAFYDMTAQLARAAARHCGGKIISALEGGYNLRALGRSVVKHLQALRDE